MPKSKSSELFGVAFPIDAAKILRAYACGRGKSVSYVLREAALEFLRREGIVIADYNPEGRGVRSDLHYATDGELKALGERLKKARASARAKKSNAEE